MKSFVKGLLMAIIGFFMATVSELETFNAAYVIIVTVIFTGGYLLKNWLMPSLTDAGRIDLRDLISGLWIAISMGVSQYAAVLLTDVEFSWKAILVAVIGAVVGYFTKTLPSKK